VLAGMEAMHAADLSGRITLNTSSPLKGAYVKIQTPGGARTIVTNTDEAGRFSIPNLPNDKILMTVEKDGAVLYRGISKVESHHSQKVIDLKEKK
jgi:hypothetical protein